MAKDLRKDEGIGELRNKLLDTLESSIDHILTKKVGECALVERELHTFFKKARQEKRPEEPRPRPAARRQESGGVVNKATGSAFYADLVDVEKPQIRVRDVLIRTKEVAEKVSRLSREIGSAVSECTVKAKKGGGRPSSRGGRVGNQRGAGGGRRGRLRHPAGQFPRCLPP